MSCPYPECGGEPAPASDSCPACHRRISPCPACAQPNRALARICRACGKPLAAAPEWPVYRNHPALGSFSAAPLDFDSIPPLRPFERLWPQVNLGEEVVAPPVLEHGLLVVCSRKGAVYLLNRFTGARLADLRLGSGECFALISGRTLVAGSGDRIVAYDLLDAFRNWNAGRFRLTERWHQTLGSGSILHPFNDVAGEALLVCTGAEDGVAVHCLKMDSGEACWPSPARIPAHASAPALDGKGFAYALAADRKIYRIAVDSGELEASRAAANPLRVDVAPAWLDATLFFFDEEGSLCACRTDTEEGMVLSRLSELTLLGVKGFAVSPRGVLVSYGRGLTRLSLGGQLIWRPDPSIESMSGSPVLAGDCGLGVGQNRGIVYLCDFKEAFLRFHQFLATEDSNWAAPAFAGRVLYTCSRRGELNALKVNAMPSP